MDALKRLVTIPASQLVGLAIAFVTIGGFLIGVFVWLQTPDYRVLFANVGDRSGGEVVTALTAMNIPFKLSESGNTVLVPSNLVPETRMRLASQGLPKGGTVGFEVMDQQKFGTTQLQEQVNFQRGLEGELAKTIQSLSAVQTARVHLGIPKPTVFLKEHQKPTASVVVSLNPGRTLDAAQVQGISHIVSASVPEMTDENVSITDGSGNPLNRKPEIGGLDPGKLAYLRELEQTYSKRITSIIETIVGVGNVQAVVTADLDFSQTEQTAETFKPNAPQNNAIRSSQTGESTSANGTAAPAGVPGAQSNTPANAGAPAPSAANATPAQSSSSSKKDNTVNYELDRMVETKKMPVGAINHLSAAIVVNNHPVAASAAADAKKDARKDAKSDGKADAKVATSQPLTKAEIEQITALAREAMGFNEKRGDSIKVENASFTQPELLAAVETPIWKDPDNISTAKEVGKNVAFALLAAYLIFGVLRPAIRKVVQSAPALPGTRNESSSIEVTPTPVLGFTDNLNRARQLARDDPKAVAGLVRNWVGANE